MKKFVNNVEEILTESLSGFQKAHPDIIKVHFTPDFIFRTKKPACDKVSLISGGGSSLLCKPRKGIEFSEKQRIFSSLFKNSAPIREINTVRKHLSEIKGGQLSKFIFPAKVRSFIISDVPGDNPADIASGITAAETTSGLDALKILKKYHVSISDQILNILKAEPSVVPPNSKFLSKTENTVIASGTNSINHAKNYANT